MTDLESIVRTIIQRNRAERERYSAGVSRLLTLSISGGSHDINKFLDEFTAIRDDGVPQPQGEAIPTGGAVLDSESEAGSGQPIENT